MNYLKFLPAAQSFGRTLVANRGELLQHGFKTYTTNYQPNSQWEGYSYVSNVHSRHWSNEAWKIDIPKNYSFSSFSETPLSHPSNDKKTANEKAHSILCSLPAYKFTTVNKEKCVASLTALTSTNTSTVSLKYPMIVNEFIDMSTYLSKRQGRKNEYEELCRKLSQILKELPFNELIKVLSAMTCWNSQDSHSPSYHLLLKSVCELNLQSFHNCTIEELLLAADCLYSLGVGGSFFLGIIRRLSRDVKKLSSSQLVQYIFYNSLHKNTIKCQFPLESRICEELDQFSPNELGIIALGMFRSQAPIQSPMILNRMIEVLKHRDLSSVPLTSLLKILRYSLKFDERDNALKTLNNLSGKLDQMSYFALTQTLLFSVVKQTVNLEVLDKCVDLAFANLKNSRLKDIEKLLQALLTFKFNSEHIPYIHQGIIDELSKESRRKEIELYPVSFLSCVLELTYSGWYPDSLISSVFEPTMSKFCVETAHEGRKMFFLHWNMAIEGPETYVGHTLSNELVSQLTQKYKCRIPTLEMKDLVKSEKQLLATQEHLNMFLNGYSSKLCRLLPHEQLPEIIFCTNHLGEPVDIPPEYFTQSELGIRKPIGDVIYNAIMVFGVNQSLHPQEFGMTGRTESKLRQLRFLGYKTGYVGPSYFRRSNTSKFAVLSQVLNEMTSLKATVNEPWFAQNLAKEYNAKKLRADSSRKS